MLTCISGFSLENKFFSTNKFKAFLKDLFILPLSCFFDCMEYHIFSFLIQFMYFNLEGDGPKELRNLLKGFDPSSWPNMSWPKLAHVGTNELDQVGTKE